MATIKEYQSDGIHEDVRAFQLELANKFPNLRVTSGVRKGAKTKQGRVSRHATGEAIDLGYDKEIADYLWNTPEGVTLLNKYNLGMLDESTPEVLAKTGGNAPHLHVGRDTTLTSKAKNRYNELVNTQQQAPITNNISDLPKIDNSVTFVPELPKEEPKVDEGKAEMQKELNEYNLKQELLQRFQTQQNPNYLQNIQDQADEEEQQMQYKPQGIEQIYNEVSNIVSMQQGGSIPTSSRGMYDYPATTVSVPTNSGRITMKNIPHQILGVDEYGNSQVMTPENEYQFKGKNILEIPDLTNFFNRR